MSNEKTNWLKPIKFKRTTTGAVDAWGYVTRSGNTLELFVELKDHTLARVKINLPRVQRWVKS